MKKWNVAKSQNQNATQLVDEKNGDLKEDKLNAEIIQTLLQNRGIISKNEQQAFLSPKNPIDVTCADVGIDEEQLKKGLKRLISAIASHESIVVYADYDADGVTAGAIMWEALHVLGADVMPYVPHRAEEGYGFSKKGIDSIIESFHPTLIVTVDHGITGQSFIAYAKEKGIDVIVTDHHVKPKHPPECITIHTTALSGAGISWFVVKELLCLKGVDASVINELLSLACLGTIADMVPLVGANRSLVMYGMKEVHKTSRLGLKAIISESGLVQKNVTSYDISHIIAPRINAMGRLKHALDSLRLLCTRNETRAKDLADKLGTTNTGRQLLTVDMVLHAKDEVKKIYGENISKKILIISHESYNQGVIGLVAGKLVERYWLPSIVIAKGEFVSKASARSIPGFNIVDAIRMAHEFLVDVGGHPMAAGFTIETKNIPLFVEILEQVANDLITDEMLVQSLHIDMELPLFVVTISLWEAIAKLEPFGIGNPSPVFATRNVLIKEIRVVGNGSKHLKLKLTSQTINPNIQTSTTVDAIAFGMGNLASDLHVGDFIDIAYSIDLNEWNGKKTIQLILKDMRSYR